MEEELDRKRVISINEDNKADDNQTDPKSHLSGKLSKISALRRTAAEEYKKEKDPKEKVKVKIKAVGGAFVQDQ